MTQAPPKAAAKPPTTPTETTSNSSIASRIRQPSPQPTRVYACIYGRGGAGKTSLLGTMPGKGLVLDATAIEDGTVVLSEFKDRIDVVDILKWDDYAEVEKMLASGNHDYKWAAIDTLTAAQELAKRKVIRERELNADPYQISQQDWGKIGTLMAELFYRYKQLKMHVILTAQERIRGSGEEGTLEYQPDVSPASLSSLIPPLFLIGRLYTREVESGEGMAVERWLRVGPHHSAVTKVRAVKDRQPPPIIRNPHLGLVFSYLLGKDVPKPEAAEESALTIIG